MRTRIHEVVEYLCDGCGMGLGNHIGNPYFSQGNNNYCPDCALRVGVITPEKWLSINGLYGFHHAEYKDGKVTAFLKWGKGYRKSEMVLPDVEVD